MSYRIPLAAFALFGVAACSSGPKAPPSTASAPAPTAAAEVDAILALLDGGDAKAAKKRIAAGLKRDPMNPSLLVLRDSIERDPKELLGPASWPYTVRAGDTMTELATRFLGNRLKAYQLARYNGIDNPAGIAAGQVLRIPGNAPRIEAPRRDEPAKTPPRAKPAPAKPAAAKPATPAPAPRAANPAAARQARAAGLAALNQGKVAVAVSQLRRAATLDPGNPLIARDLARAQRIAATVRARK
ncbi:LysM peptidoglycan-binding domain-containing protein [Sphingomonas sp. SUN019]|uniref:LysM peptidoglycan-binding domain-containing protein n=1 Tax=Sphingomonas sp. SUN019 TaxID=2937788 RepID=UPI002164CD06|nr:LysM peptidoglycan-binding domain-containing protein [Sphingomonas sp. SUN019]UVO50476.1 LysM peptidoglycan-binding domain-containing protein [Sphingomonas sp. SUN019]